MSLINRLNPSTWAAFGLSLLLSFSAGYAYRWHQDGLKEAKHEATQVATTKTAEAAITVTDEQIVQRLRTQLNTTKQRSSVLERTIEELQHANLNNNPDCSLPIGLRDQINLELTRNQE